MSPMSVGDWVDVGQGWRVGLELGIVLGFAIFFRFAGRLFRHFGQRIRGTIASIATRRCIRSITGEHHQRRCEHTQKSCQSGYHRGFRSGNQHPSTEGTSETGACRCGMTVFA